jgi:hypothetical protein
MSSNFFAITSAQYAGHASVNASKQERDCPVVITAPPATVLRGTIMRIVEEACQKLNIPLYYQFPKITDAKAGHWYGAFITSKFNAMQIHIYIHQHTHY